MKIERFYEKKEIRDDYTKKDWTLNKLRNHMGDHYYIAEMLTKYIKYKEELNDDFYVIIKDFNFRNSFDFVIEYSASTNYATAEQETDWFDYTADFDEQKEIIEFINNPDIYPDIKNFNL